MLPNFFYNVPHIKTLLYINLRARMTRATIDKRYLDAKFNFIYSNHCPRYVVYLAHVNINKSIVKLT